MTSRKNNASGGIELKEEEEWRRNNNAYANKCVYNGLQ